MSRRLLGGVVTVIGAVILVVSVFANHLGVGDTGSFGWKQITGTVVGGAIVGLGVAMLILARPAGAADV